MAVDPSKKRFAALATGVALSSVAAATLIYLLRNKNAEADQDLKNKIKEYEALREKLKEESKFLDSDNETKKQIDSFLNDKKTEQYSIDNKKAIDKLLNDLANKIKSEKDKINLAIDKIGSNSLKEALKNESQNLKDADSKNKLIKDVEKSIALEKEVKDNIALVKDSDKKSEFENRLNDKIKNLDDLNSLNQDILIQLAKEQDQNAFELLKASLIQRINESSLTQNIKDELIARVKNAQTKEELELIKNQLDTLILAQWFKDENVKRDFEAEILDSTSENINQIKAKISNSINEIKNIVATEIGRLIIAETKKSLTNKLENIPSELENEKLLIETKNEVAYENIARYSEQLRDLLNYEISLYIVEIKDLQQKDELKAKLREAKTFKDLIGLKQQVIELLAKQDKDKLVSIIQSVLSNKLNHNVQLVNKSEIEAKLKDLNEENKDALIKLVNDSFSLHFLVEEALKLVNGLNESDEKTKYLDTLAKADIQAYELWDIITNIQAYYSPKKEKVANRINNEVKSKNKQSELKRKLEDAKSENELNNIEKEIDQHVKEANDVKDDILKLLDKLDNGKVKEQFKEKINDPNTYLDDLERIKEDINKILLEAWNKAKKAVSKLDDDKEFTRLNKILDDNKNTLKQSELKEIEEKANSIFNNQKDSATALINESVLSENVKNDLKEDLNSAENIKQIKVVLKKIEAYKNNHRIINDNNKDKQDNAIKNIDIKQGEDALNKIDEINAETEQIIKAEANDAFNDLKDKISNLRYPSGKNSKAVKEMLKVIEDLENNTVLTHEQKTDKVREINQKINTLSPSIDKLKDEIHEVSEGNHQNLSDLLDKSNLLAEVDNAFKDVEDAIKAAKLKDKSDAKNTVNSLNNLNTDEKNKFNTEIDKDSTKTYDQIQKIVEEAKLQDIKNQLINQAEQLEYPDKNNAKAVKEIKDEINSLANSNDIVNYGNKLSTIKNNITQANSELAKLKYVSDEIKTTFNSAKEQQDFDNLMQLINNKLDIQNQKEALDNEIEALPYPNKDGGAVIVIDNDAPAIGEIKKQYVDANGEGIKEKIEEYKNKLDDIKAKITQAKANIEKISQAKQKDLFEELRKSYTEEHFTELNKKIKDAFDQDKNEAKNTIDSLNNLNSEIKKQEYKDKIDHANNINEINNIIREATLENYKDELKGMLNISDYVSGESDEEIKANYEKTKKEFDYKIDQTVINEETYKEKKKTVEEFKVELKKAKDAIDSLTSDDVNNLGEAKKDLNKLITAILETNELEKVHLEIEKYKLKKTVNQLDYDKTNSQIPDAIVKLEEEINKADKNELKNIENNVKAIPDEIKKAKDAINALTSTSTEEAEKRKKDLLVELNKAYKPEHFDALMANIEKAKQQSDEEYRESVKQQLIERVKNLQYPKNNGQQSQGVTSLINNITTDFEDQNNDTTELKNKWDSEISKLDTEINKAVNNINKLNPTKISNFNNELNTKINSSEFTAFHSKINESMEADKKEIADKIKALPNLKNSNNGQADNLVNKLNGKSWNEMNLILNEAYKADLDERIEKLAYPSKDISLKTASISKLKQEYSNIVGEQDYKDKLDEIEKLDNAIKETTQKIDNLPYKTNDALARQTWKDNLTKLTTEEDVKALIPDIFAEKLNKHYSYIVRTPYPITNTEPLLAEFEKVVTDEDFNRLNLDIYNSKRAVAHNLIDELDNLSNDQKDAKKALIKEKQISEVNIENDLAEIDKIILDSLKSDSKALVAKIAYPQPDQAQEAINKLNSEVDQKTTEEEVKHFNEKIQKILKRMLKTINKLSTANPKIDDEYLTKIDGLRNKATEESDFDNIDLQIEIAIAAKQLEIRYKNLSSEQIKAFKDELNQQQNNEGIQQVLEKAKLQNEREELIKLINNLPYTNKHLEKAQNSIKKLTDEVNSLNSEADIENKKKEIQEFSNLLTSTIKLVKELPYPDENSHAITQLFNAIDGITKSEDLQKLLDENWKNKVSKYKDTINTYFGHDTEALGALNRTYPVKNSDDTKGLNEAELKQFLIERMIALSTARIDLLMDDAIKNNAKKEINELKDQAISEFDTQDTLKLFYDVVNNATIEDAKKAINALAYPNSEQAKNTKANIISALVQKHHVDKNANINTGINGLVDEIKSLQEAVNNVKNAVAQIKSTQKQAEFNNEFANKATKVDLDDLVTKINKYKELEDIINSMSDIDRSMVDITNYDNSEEDINAVNEKLAKLRNKLTTKLALVNFNDLENERPLLDEYKKAYELIKTNFVNRDTLMMATLIEKLINTNTVSEIQNVISDANNAKSLLDMFWKDNEGENKYGKFIKANSDVLEKNSKEDSSKRLVNGSNYKTYAQILKEIRTTNIENLRDIVVNKLPLYSAVIEYLNIDKTHVTENALKWVTTEILKQTTKRDIERYTTEIYNFNDLGKQIKTALLDFGKPSNKTEVESTYKNATRANDLRSLLTVVKEFKQAFREVEQLIKQYEAKPNQDVNKLNVYNAELDKVTNKVMAEALRDKIILKENALAKIEGLTNLNNEQKAYYKDLLNKENNLANIQDIIEKFSALDSKIKEIRDILKTIGVESNQSEFKDILDKAKTVEDLNGVKENVNSFKESYAGAKKLVDAFQNYSGKTEDKVNDFNNLILTVTNAEKSKELANKVKAEFENNLKAIIDQIDYPNKESELTKSTVVGLKNSISNLQSHEYEQKYKDLNALKEAMNSRANKVDSLEYIDNNAEAKSKIKTGLQRATTAEEVINVFPDDWDQKVKIYNKLITTYFTNTRARGLIDRFNKTTNSDPSLTPAELEKQILLTGQAVAKENVNRFNHLDSKQAILDAIDNVDKSKLLSENDDNAMKQIADKYLEALKTNYTKFINNLAYPSGVNEQTSKASKAKLIEDLITKFNKNKSQLDDLSEVETLETKLNEINQLITNINSALQAIDNTIQAKVLANFQSKYASADSKEKLESTLKSIMIFNEAIKNIKDNVKFEDKDIDNNRHANSEEDKRKVKETYAKLKNHLEQKAISDSINNANEVKKYVDNVIESVKYLKENFKQDIIVESTLLDIDEKITKYNTEADKMKQEIKDFKAELERFWNGPGNLSGWIETYKDILARNTTDKFKNYEEVVREARNKKSAQELEDFNDNVIPLYHGYIDLLNVIVDKDMPDSALANFKNRASNAPDKDTITDIIIPDANEYLTFLPEAIQWIDNIDLDTSDDQIVWGEYQTKLSEADTTDKIKALVEKMRAIDEFYNRAETRLKNLKAQDKDPQKEQKRKLNAPEKAYLQEYRKNLIKNPDNAQALEREFILTRYYQSKKLFAVIQTIEFIEGIVARNHKNIHGNPDNLRLDRRYWELIEKFRYEEGFIKEYRNRGSNIGDTYVYTENGKNDRTADQLAHMWLQIEPSGSVWNRDDSRDLLSGATQWNIKWPNEADIKSHKFGDYEKTDSILTYAYRKIGEMNNLSNEDLYKAIDDIAGFGFANHSDNNAQEEHGLYSVKALLRRISSEQNNNIAYQKIMLGLSFLKAYDFYRGEKGNVIDQYDLDKK